MIGIAGIALLAPLAGVFTYHRAGLRWRSAAGLSALAVLASFAAALVLGFAYGFGIAIDAGLCGHEPWEASAVGLVAYAIAGSWALLSPKRFWAWPFAAGGAMAAALLVAYFFAGAHHYCET